MIVTKFEVAERQLLQAVRMFFNHDDEISIHTLSEAANQVFYDIGGEFEVASMFRDSQFLSKEVKKTFLKNWFKSRNFFKHADRDKYETHEFHEVYNHFSLLDGANMHYKIKGSMVPETLCLNVWFAHALICSCQTRHSTKRIFYTKSYPNSAHQRLTNYLDTERLYATIYR